MNNVMVIAVHPDDETLGCGGTLLKHKKNGDKINWLICSETELGTDFYKSREIEIERVSGLYGFDSVVNLKLKSMKIDEYSMSYLVGHLSRVISDVKPTVVYIPFKGDVHSDHRKIFEAAYSCTKSFRYPFIKKVYMMETLSETEFAPSLVGESFVPNVYVDISQYMKEKIEILKVFESEIHPHPFPRSEKNVRALGSFRGATSSCEYAESFMLLKEIR